MFYMDDLDVPVFARDIRDTIWLKATLLEIKDGIALIRFKDQPEVIVSLRSVHALKSRPFSHHGTKKPLIIHPLSADTTPQQEDGRMAGFKKGEEVKAFCKLGAQKEAKWNVVTYLGPQTITFSGQHQSCAQIKHYQRLDSESLAKYARDNVGRLLDYIKRGMESLLPLHSDEVALDLQEPTIINLPCGLTVSPIVVEVETISAFVEHPGWEIVEWNNVPATRWEPADVTDRQVAQSRSELQAAAASVQAVFSALAEGFWEGEGENEMCRQMEEDKRLIAQFEVAMGKMKPVTITKIMAREEEAQKADVVDAPCTD